MALGGACGSGWVGAGVNDLLWANGGLKSSSLKDTKDTDNEVYTVSFVALFEADYGAV